jgi:4-amino-4-deoxy-L-arabinose transferase-like glycosyltransferase
MILVITVGAAHYTVGHSGARIIDAPQAQAHIDRGYPYSRMSANRLEARPRSPLMKSWKDLVLIVVLMLISGVPRALDLGAFTSVDEPFWLRQGANFYYALGQREFQNTIYEYHPAVTTMWIVSAGMLLYFPEYRTLEQGYLKPGKFDMFLPAHGKDPLQLLITSRAVQIVVILLLLAGLYLLLKTLFDRAGAFAATGLVSLSPFFLGHSRLLNHEALLALFILDSVLLLLVYLWRSQKLSLLLLSGTAAGLAQLTKSSGILLFPLVILILAVDSLVSGHRGPLMRAAGAARVFGIWLGATVVSYFIFWPGMWVAPVKMLSDVYGNALSYTFQGARLSVLPGLEPGAFGLDTLWGGLQIYLSDLAWRTTPLTWLALAVGVVMAISLQKQRKALEYRLLVLYSMLLAAGFVLMFSVQRGPKPPHYTVTSYACIGLIGGLGIVQAWKALQERLPVLRNSTIMWGTVALAVGLQLAFAFAAFPYFISYYNPVLEALEPGIQNPTLNVTGYGVGLDQAAAYLSRKPDAAGMTVMAANGYGCFSYYFTGRTIAMNNLVLSDPQLVEILRGSQYAVVDYFNQRRNQVADGLDGISPEKTIWINGRDFLRIYRASDLLARVPAGIAP